MDSIYFSDLFLYQCTEQIRIR